MNRGSLRAWTGVFLLMVVTAFITWAAVFEIDQSVRAQGQVIPEDRTQVIQAADGGVLQSLLVSEGQRVRKGQLLASLGK
jgi:adhesin transport system membrane fusion protein